MYNTYCTIKKFTKLLALITISASLNSAWEVETIANCGRPHGITYLNNNLYVTDSNNYISKLALGADDKWTVSTIAGVSGNYGSIARFNYPCGITSISNDLYVADTYNSRICKLVLNGDKWTVSTIAGPDDFPFYPDEEIPGGPYDVTSDSSGNLYVADTVNNRICKLVSNDNKWTVSIVTEQIFSEPCGLTMDNSGNLYVADTYNHRICKLVLNGDKWTVSTIAGPNDDTYGFKDGIGSEARFTAPSSIVYVNNLIYIADTGNDCIREIHIATGEVKTIAGGKSARMADGKGSEVKFFSPSGITNDSSGNLYVADTLNNRICKLFFVKAAVENMNISTTQQKLEPKVDTDTIVQAILALDKNLTLLITAIQTMQEKIKEVLR